MNVGDQIQMISNDKYKSVLHRALVNCKKERVSIPSYDTTRMSGTGDFPNKLASISSRPKFDPFLNTIC